jgi:deoxyribodipyrimidine photolyase-related protein
VRGIYRHRDAEQSASNFFGHRRRLTPHWYDGTTGLPPLDDAIRTAQARGWTHHIVRLMVIGNAMTLAEIAPLEAHRWFMELYVDSADWVMGPNVYGMGIFSDGGIFATKPYVSASSYLLKMSDYGRGDWCDVLDGLYWRFVAKHREFFAAQPRLAVMVGGLDRLAPARRELIFGAAESYLARCTREG